jgi:hypothetical protein
MADDGASKKGRAEPEVLDGGAMELNRNVEVVTIYIAPGGEPLNNGKGEVLPTPGLSSARNRKPCCIYS